MIFPKNPKKHLFFVFFMKKPHFLIGESSSDFGVFSLFPGGGRGILQKLQKKWKIALFWAIFWAIFRSSSSGKTRENDSPNLMSFSSKRVIFMKNEQKTLKIDLIFPIWGMVYKRKIWDFDQISLYIGKGGGRTPVLIQPIDPGNRWILVEKNPTLRRLPTQEFYDPLKGGFTRPV